MSWRNGIAQRRQGPKALSAGVYLLSFLAIPGCKAPTPVPLPQTLTAREESLVDEAIRFAHSYTTSSDPKWASAFIRGAEDATNSFRQGKPMFLRPLWSMVEGQAFSRELGGQGAWFPHTEGSTTIIRRIPDTGGPDYPFNESTGLPFMLPNDLPKGDIYDSGWNLALIWLAEHGVYAVNSTKRKHP